MLKIIMQTIWEIYAITSMCFITPIAILIAVWAKKSAGKEGKTHENFDA